jgi:hypothetical protein
MAENAEGRIRSLFPLSRFRSLLRRSVQNSQSSPQSAARMDMVHIDVQSLQGGKQGFTNVTSREQQSCRCIVRLLSGQPIQNEETLGGVRFELESALKRFPSLLESSLPPQDLAEVMMYPRIFGATLYRLA